ncbi:hypothetical protein [Geomicrobium sediminis]|uniref:Uncharacterized protein n=1 Tax=Geomicrobium sediminis TaxID=1347788 RepID=A0ABS2P6V7_9BACL|nr:hypothetical protein [Geomicrobium sediminis]MBM7631076.1 hypothetical protein [Geomicrobium sediminis]
MLKIFAAILSPFVFSLLIGIYQIPKFILNSTFPSFPLDSYYLIFLIYALPAYLLLAVPASFIIEHINKGIRWVNYSVAGVLGGLMIYFVNNSPIDWEILLYLLAGLSFYVSLKVLEISKRKNDFYIK